jgi:hypothetical protein
MSDVFHPRLVDGPNDPLPKVIRSGSEDTLPTYDWDQKQEEIITEEDTDNAQQ